MSSDPRRKALLVGLHLPRTIPAENEASLRELARLVQTLGYDVVGSITQKRNSSSGALVLGEGKLRELSRWTGGPGEVQSPVDVKKHKAALRFGQQEGESADESLDFEDAETDGDGAREVTDEVLEDADGGSAPGEKPDVIVFDVDLSPSQLRNLESATGSPVLDRTGVIIEIFSRHARTRASRLQVEIARLNYMAPRIRETGGNQDRGGGGIGSKGSGETAHELDRRRIRDRIKELKDELENVQNEHAVRRTRRSSENTVALVGYTNAGKSSLMRAMTGSEIYVADKLFATLDTTVRPMQPESMPKVLLSDTVGFIKKLPHDLVASFRSTLDEALSADLLLYVVDASDPTFRSQLEVTRTVLGEIGATETESRIVLNKRDRLNDVEIAELRAEYPDAIVLSTRNPEDLSMLRDHLLAFFEGDMQDAKFFVPYTMKGAIGDIRARTRVVTEDFDGLGVTVVVRGPQLEIERIRRVYGVTDHPVEHD